MQNIGVSDITMKVADQAPELSLSFKEKIELAKLLDRLKALEMLTALTEEGGEGMEEFLRALKDIAQD